jgi:hypothetical protein
VGRFFFVGKCWLKISPIKRYRCNIVEAAEYRAGEWRIEGTSAVVGPGVTVTIYLGNTNQIIGSGAVDTLGVWRFRGTSLRVTQAGTITAKSPTSANVPSFTYRFR